MKSCRVHGGEPPRILNTLSQYQPGISFALEPCHLILLIVFWVVWTPGLVWTCRRKENCCSIRESNPNRSAYSLLFSVWPITSISQRECNYQFRTAAKKVIPKELIGSSRKNVPPRVEFPEVHCRVHKSPPMIPVLT
jgi:hypothetical protein